MKISTRITNQGITLSIGDGPKSVLKPSPTASQTKPKRNYVYGHLDERGIPFYIGKGTGRRAWDEDRHPLWDRYVQNHLGGKYSVVILNDDLSSEQAEELESEWIAQESETLVNWINFGRKTDFVAVDKFHKLRDANRAVATRAREQEQENPAESIRLYLRALENIAAYAAIQPDLGLVGKLIDEERKDTGINGDLPILDRLTLCLIRANRGTEAATLTEEYFKKYRADEERSTARRIRKRVDKVIRKS